MSLFDDEHQIRLKAFEWLEKQTLIHGDVLPRPLLERGYKYQGTQIHLLGAQGIWKPRIFEKIPLSITTTPNSPYPDSHDYEGNLIYSYRGTDPNHPDNAGLRIAMQERTPLIYFLGVEVGRYLPTWPVYITHDDPKNLRCHVDISERFMDAFVRAHNTVSSKNTSQPIESSSQGFIDDAEILRKYAARMSKVRLHQTAFRERVIHAYRCHCTMCKLKHRELLDAAHITPDREESGEPVVSNGLSLCKIHHAAYDKHILGVSPDYIIHVREDILEEIDGPMLRYGLQGMHGQKLHAIPSKREHRPDRERLEHRFDAFLHAG